MADKILKSITFPNLPDKYIIPETTVDSVPTQGSANAISSGAVYTLKEDFDTIESTVTDLSASFSNILVEDHGEGEQVTLTNAENASDFYNGMTGNGISKTSLLDGLALFTSKSNSQVNPYARHFCSLGSGKWLVGFKYRITKLDTSLGDPTKIVFLLGNTRVETAYTWGTWVEFTHIAEDDLTKLYISVYGFQTAPTTGQFTLEFKDMYAYEVTGVSDEMLTKIQSEQIANYQDGTVTYGESVTTTYTPDTTLSKSGKAADSKAVGDEIGRLAEDVQGFDAIKTCMQTVFDHSEEESVSLTNQDSLTNIVSKYAATLVSYIDGVKTFTFGDGSQINPAVAHSNMSLSSGRWLVGFKYRLKKLDDSVSDPTDVRILLGSNAYTKEVVYNEWVEFNESVTDTISQVYIAVRGFNPAPTTEQFQIEIKDYYIYDISDVDADMLATVISVQSTSFTDGTATFTIPETYTPDTTLSKSGKAADSKAVGDAISTFDARLDIASQVLEVSMQNASSITNLRAKYGLTRDSVSANLAVYTPSSEPNVSPTVRDQCALGESKWLVGFKYRITKLDTSLGDPECVRILFGESEYEDYTVVYDSWVEVAEIKTVNLTQVYFALRNYATAPTSGQLKIEIKDYYIYDVASLKPDIIDYIVAEQSLNCKDGTVTYTTYALSNLIQSSLNIINVKNYGVSGDGVTDDTAAINKLFATRRGIFYFPAGIYLFSGTIEIPEDSIMCGDGENTVLDMYSCDNLENCIFREEGNWRVYPYILVRSKNVIIRKLKVIGNDTLHEQRHAAIYIMDTRNCAVEDVTVYNINFDAEQDFDADVSGYGICVNRSQFVNVERVNAQRCGYECIGIVFECNHCVVRDCYTQDGWRTCIQVHRGSCNTTVENCYMKQTHTKYDACFTVHGLEGYEVGNLRVVNCTLECTINGAQPNNYNAPAQIMSYAIGMWFTNNRITGGKRALYITSDSVGAVIMGNVMDCNSDSDYGLYIRSENALLIGNKLTNGMETPINTITSSVIQAGNYGIN